MAKNCDHNDELARLIEEQERDRRMDLMRPRRRMRPRRWEEEMGIDDARLHYIPPCPEEEVIRREERQRFHEALTGLGEETLQVARRLMDGATFKELCRSSGRSRLELLEILATVVHVLAPERAPDMDQVMARANVLAEESDPTRASGRLFLSPEARRMPLDRLWSALKRAGFNVSRPTAWRGKSVGWFLSDGRGGTGRRASHGFVLLTDEEREMSARKLAKELGVTQDTARAALQRGWFEVTANMRNLKVDHARIVQGDLPT